VNNSSAEERVAYSGLIDISAQNQILCALMSDTPTPLEGCDSPIGYQ